MSRFSNVQQHFQIVRVHPVVAVHKADPLAVAVGKGPVDTGVPGSRQSPILLMNDMHARILLRIVIADRAAVVRAAIVHEDQLEVCKRLREDAVYAAAEIGFDLIDGNNNGNQRHYSSSLQNAQNVLYKLLIIMLQMEIIIHMLSLWDFPIFLSNLRNIIRKADIV